ncbi:hypothetical protein [Altererythrobacter ishigakiensis]|nr:hypothetical protein [Altererythrobacter ishigakiensis]MDX1704582.1 hypothetical protein [Altererythrobacter ishigakiensis]
MLEAIRPSGKTAIHPLNKAASHTAQSGTKAGCRLIGAREA